jgi:hypothetical protein
MMFGLGRWFSTGKASSRGEAEPDLNGLQDNSRWYHRTCSPTVFVFVHGLLSNSTSCWTSAAGVFWPDLIKQDAAFDGASIFLGGYYTAVDSGQYDVAQCADELFEALTGLGEGGAPVLAHANIVFVCHSLGGVIVRRMLEENVASFTCKTVGLVLIASPTLGSEYAAMAKFLSKLYGNRTAQSLVPDSDLLRDIDNRFRRLIEQRRIPCLIGAEACEHHSPWQPKWLPRLFGAVVSSNSASRYFGQTKVIPGTDHFDIVKPNDRSHPTYRFLRTFYSAKFKPSAQVVLPTSAKLSFGDPRSNGTVPLAARVLFDVYSAASRDFYVDRAEDDDFSRAMQLGSVWATGPSGTGKTSIAKRFVDLHGFSPVEVSLAHYANGFDREEVAREILAGLSILEDDPCQFPENSLTTVARKLSERAAESPVPLLLDEVPVHNFDVEGQKKLVQFIADLLDLLKKKNGLNAQVIVCSIGKPPAEVIGEKLLDQMTFVLVKPWAQHDLVRLGVLVQEQLPAVAISAPCLKRVVENSLGAPRFLKSYFRRRLRTNMELEEESETLSRTLESFGRYANPTS